MHAWLFLCILITLTLTTDAACLGGSPKNVRRAKNSPKGSPQIGVKAVKRNLSKSSPAIGKGSSKKADRKEEAEGEMTSATDLEGGTDPLNLRVTYDNQHDQ